MHILSPTTTPGQLSVDWWVLHDRNDPRRTHRYKFIALELSIFSFFFLFSFSRSALGVEPHTLVFAAVFVHPLT